MNLKQFVFLLVTTFGASSIAMAQVSVIESSKYPKLTVYTAQQDQANMMQQLGIKKSRPGKSGNTQDPNAANYDEALANPCPLLEQYLN